jgi:hypothetical protein
MARRALRDLRLSERRDTIIFIGKILTNTMEMDAGTVICKFIVDSHNDSVTPVSLDGRTRHLAIDKKSNPLNTIRRDRSVCNIEVIGNSIACLRDILIPVGIDIETTEIIGIASRLAFTRNA